MKKDKSFYIILGFFILAGALSWQLYFKEYLQKDTANIHLFPKQIKEWTSRELTITDKEYEILETRNAFMREYSRASGEKVYLFIVYSQYNRKVSHPPEVCYTGSGTTILEHSVSAITIAEQNLVLDVNRLVMESRAEQQIAYYWFKVGGSFTASYWKQQALIAFKTLFNQPASSALIRISTDVKGNDKELAAKTLKEFSATILPYLYKYLP
ncbi:MAG TPA: EpsI family protein [Candidatus Omnitrophota bacterium]|nr:EpsI family protein [Candidatus Omnitrophota bacterium]HPD85193.1 EpsI family protein [Candidatus Omnitrophota bacterium]HRZ04306.1 EpsI family protein [Candidatus Omnitrophota bacterium]